MCYVNGIKISKAEFIRLKQLEKLAGIDLDIPLRSGFTYEDWPILKPSADNKDFEVDMAHWEFVPKWTTAAAFDHKYPTLNARGEEILEKPTFKDAARESRCLVLSSGFYEWRHISVPGKKTAQKIPYYITLPGAPFFYMAGVWEPKNNSFAIVTTAANSLMEQVHNAKKRMPLILPEDLAYNWLLGPLTDAQILDITHYQFGADKMTAWPVATDFLKSGDPAHKVEYEGLPELEGVGNGG